MEYYLLCHGEANEAAALDPYAASLTERGRRQAKALANLCQYRGVQFICASTAVRAEQTADAVEAAVQVLRWDLKELELLTIDDMEGQVVFSSHPARWSPEQFRYGMERLWVRLVGALARIEIYAATYGIQRVALVSHPDVINLCLLSWLGLDWTSYDYLRFAIDAGSSSLVMFAEGAVTFAWLNRPSLEAPSG
ncbi:MAG: histidine phosphatase family protein [Chloroflexi bacterium]|nr:histidine phosphatase family protein [Chloroflexota bacterium]